MGQSGGVFGGWTTEALSVDKDSLSTGVIGKPGASKLWFGQQENQEEPGQTGG